MEHRDRRHEETSVAEVREYTPDGWQILKLAFPGKAVYYRILAGWGGGYTQGQSWKLSSGITGIQETDDCYVIINASGSVYNCRKTSNRMLGMMGGILSSVQNEHPEAITVVDIDEALVQYLHALTKDVEVDLDSPLSPDDE